jgi:HD-GYP domain-containing protein (c-di-GMP phosphodiesterase class II)
MEEECANFVKVGVPAVQALVDRDSADFQVFLPGAEGKDPVLYRRPGAGLSVPDFERMREHGVPYVYLSPEDFENCERMLEAKLGEILQDSDVAASDKAGITHAVGTSIARSLINGHGSSVSFDRGARALDGMIEGVMSDPAVGAYMVQMAGHDRTTAGHMFMVSMLAVLLGLEVFGPDRAILRALGAAGMLHDLGKLGIAQELLGKSGPLTREEQLLIQQHPIESVRLIGDDPHITPNIRQMIVQHHERIDGRGYPLGLGAADLLTGSRILSIVDSFHALIGRRPYRTPMTPADANRLLAKQAGGQFDPDFLACWTALFERCWSEEGDVLMGPHIGACDELSSRHEHSPAPPPPSFHGARQRRFVCHRDTAVRCIYAGRLQDVSSAPDEFTALIHDASRGGLCIRTPFPMYRGEIVYVHLDAGSARVWIRSMVAWCRLFPGSGYRIGLRFDHRMSRDDIHLRASVTGMPTHETSSSRMQASLVGPNDLAEL